MYLSKVHFNVIFLDVSVWDIVAAYTTEQN